MFSDFAEIKSLNLKPTLSKYGGYILVIFSKFEFPAQTIKQLMQRSILQTFWKPDSCPDFLFFELEPSNLGYMLIF